MATKRLITLKSIPADPSSNFVAGNIGGSYLPAVIRCSFTKTSETNWDQVVNLTDITGDGILPGNINIASTWIDLRYYQAQFPPGTVASLRKVKVTFASGHIEQFDIWLAPSNFGTPGNAFINTTSSGQVFGLSRSSQGGFYNTHIAATNTSPNFYSVTPDFLYVTSIGYRYSIFTKYRGGAPSPVFSNSNPNFTSSEIYGEFKPGSLFYPWFPQYQFNMAGASHADRIAYNYGNGFTTPLPNSTRQEWHRLDVLLQDNNPQWFDNLGTDSSGALIDQTYIRTTLQNNLGPGTGTFSQGNPVPNLDPGLYAMAVGDQAQNERVWDSLNDAVMSWPSLLSLLTTTGEQRHFVYSIYYSMGLDDPTLNPITDTFHVCLTDGNPSYYITTSKDCNGNTIPAANLPGGADFATTAFVDGACCADCSDLDVSLSLVCSDFSTDNGTILVSSVYDPTATNNWSSGSWYTYTLALSTGVAIDQTAPPTGGNTATAASCVTNITSGTANTVTCPSSALITPGLQVSGAGIPAGAAVGVILAGVVGTNVTQFTLVDMLTGASVDATAAATVTLTFSAGITHEWGSLTPNDAAGTGAGSHYIVTVTDENGCVDTFNVVIERCPDTEGCTNTDSINYDATANIDNGTCLLCDVDSGALEDVNGNDLGQLFVSTQTNIIDATVNSSNVPQSDGIIAAIATVEPTLQQYISTGAAVTYTMTLYPVAAAGDPTTIGSVAATQAGIASNTFSYSPQHTFTGLAYGHYAIKVQFVDSNSVLEVEQCFTWIFGTVMVPVCDDPLDTDYNITVPSDFRIPDNSLCSSGCPTCVEYIELVTIPQWYNMCSSTLNTNSASLCNPSLVFAFACSPSGTGQCTGGPPIPPGTYIPGSWNTTVWLFNGIPIVNQQTVNVGNDLSGYGWGITNQNIMGGNFSVMGQLIDQVTISSPLQVLGSGTYTVEQYAVLADGTFCMQSQSYSYTQLNDGCLDPTSLNFNPAATCPGPCIYESFDCDAQGNCVDPGTGLGQYSTLSDCQINCLPPPVIGCTDPCAVNFNPAATVDDGSCLFKACLDPTAANQYWSCDCNANIPSATINDQACCFFPCASSPITTLTTVNASGSCTTPNSDGIVNFTQLHTNGASVYKIRIFDITGTLLYSLTVIQAANATSAVLVTYSLLPPGVYTLETTDSLGCIFTTTFSIGTDAANVGCTDPLADNYDPTALCDDGSCVYCGCTDPLADNYNPNAVCDDGTCIYTEIHNPCVPKDLKKALLKLDTCLSEKGSEWLQDYKIGTNIDCLTMDKWKLILMNYVLKADRSEQGFGLACLFNCADNATSSIDSIVDSCSGLWTQGGPNTGVNDTAQAGSSIATGEGTTITDNTLFWVSTNTLAFGDVVKMPSGLIYEFIGILSTPFALDPTKNPETASGATSGKWKQCVDSSFINITNSVNYYDNFINFVNKFCKDCNIPTAYKQ